MACLHPGEDMRYENCLKCQFIFAVEQQFCTTFVEGRLLHLMAVVGTSLCFEVSKPPVTELTVPVSGLGAEQYTLLHLNKRYIFFFTLLSPCISMNQIKIKRPTNALFNYFISTSYNFNKVLTKYRHICVL
jgi:hypothetical protein